MNRSRDSRRAFATSGPASRSRSLSTSAFAASMSSVGGRIFCVFGSHVPTNFPPYHGSTNRCSRRFRRSSSVSVFLFFAIFSFAACFARRAISASCAAFISAAFFGGYGMIFPSTGSHRPTNRTAYHGDVNRSCAAASCAVFLFAILRLLAGFYADAGHPISPPVHFRFANAFSAAACAAARSFSAVTASSARYSSS